MLLDYFEHIRHLPIIASFLIRPYSSFERKRHIWIKAIGENGIVKTYVHNDVEMIGRGKWQHGWLLGLLNGSNPG